MAKLKFPERVLSAVLAAAMAIPVMTMTAFAADANQMLTTVLPEAVKGTAYAVQLETTREDPVWRSSTLPDGMTLDSDTGILTGVPTTDGVYSIQFCDSTSSEAKTIGLKVLAKADPSTGGALVWSVNDGVLPKGVTLDHTTGVIKGIPTQSGDFVGIKFAATNSLGSSIQEYTMKVASSVKIDTGMLFSGYVGSCTRPRWRPRTACPAPGKPPAFLRA